MRWPPYSQNQIAPSGPRTAPKGLLSCAALAGPSSPEKPFTPVPAKVAIVAAWAAAVRARRNNAKRIGVRNSPQRHEDTEVESKEDFFVPLCLRGEVISTLRRKSRRR